LLFTVQLLSNMSGGSLAVRVLEGTDLVWQPPARATALSRFAPFIKPGSPGGARGWGLSTGSASSTNHAISITAALERSDGGDAPHRPSHAAAAAAGSSNSSNSIAVRTSARLIGADDKGGSARWHEDFAFSDVSSSMVLRITCVDRVSSASSGERSDVDDVVGQTLVPIARLPENEAVEQWYQLHPPPGSELTFIKAAVRLRLCFKRGEKSSARAEQKQAGLLLDELDEFDAEPQLLRSHVQHGDGSSSSSSSSAAASNNSNSVGAVNSGSSHRRKYSSIAPARPSLQQNSRRTSILRAVVTPLTVAEAGVLSGEDSAGNGNSNDDSSDDNDDDGASLNGESTKSRRASRRRAAREASDASDAVSSQEEGSSAVQQHSAAAGAAAAAGDQKQHKQQQQLRKSHSSDRLASTAGASAAAAAASTAAANSGDDSDATTSTAAAAASASADDPLAGWHGASDSEQEAAAARRLAREALPSGIVDYFLVVGALLTPEGRLQEPEAAASGFGSGGQWQSNSAQQQADEQQSAWPPVTQVELACGVLDSFPRQQRAAVPHTTRVEWFCFPGGLRLRASVRRPQPRLGAFVRFINGVRSYGLCLTYYRRATVVAPSTSTAASTAAAAAGDAGGSAAGEHTSATNSSSSSSSTAAAAEAGGQSSQEAAAAASSTTAAAAAAAATAATSAKQHEAVLWVPVCLCVLTHLPILEELTPWLKAFHHCMETAHHSSSSSSGSSSSSSSGAAAAAAAAKAQLLLHAAVFQLTVEVPLPLPGVCCTAVRAFGPLTLQQQQQQQQQEQLFRFSLPAEV
jgi:trimeric autotransporter adhesin